MTKTTPSIFRVTAVLGVLAALCQLAIAWAGSAVARETAYPAALVWHVYVTFMAFVLLLYGVRKVKE